MRARSIAIISLILIAILVSALSDVFTVSPQEKLAEIYTLAYEPEKPVVLESIQFTVGVKNNENQLRNYRLELIITKDGIFKDSQEFTFNLKPESSTAFSPNYIPDDINDFDLITKLYDATTSQLLDLKTLKFRVVSEIGPFDLEVNVPSKFIKANSIAPVILTLSNKGINGTDINVEIELKCVNQSNIRSSFFFFIPTTSVETKITPIQTCDEEGPHEISASIILFNKTWISSANQFFLNKTYQELLFDVPTKININAGESKIFDVQIRNTGTTTLHNLRLLVSIISNNWIKISPQAVTQLNPGEFSIFVVNITVPKDASSQEFPVGIAAAADELLTRKETTFNVAALSALPQILNISSKETIPKIVLPRILTDNATYILIAVLILVGIFALIKTIEVQRRSRREEVVRKLKDLIG